MDDYVENIEENRLNLKLLQSLYRKSLDYVGALAVSRESEAALFINDVVHSNRLLWRTTRFVYYHWFTVGLYAVTDIIWDGELFHIHLVCKNVKCLFIKIHVTPTYPNKT